MRLLVPATGNTYKATADEYAFLFRPMKMT